MEHLYVITSEKDYAQFLVEAEYEDPATGIVHKANILIGDLLEGDIPINDYTAEEDGFKLVKEIIKKTDSFKIQ